jgi:hypothetical protein
MLLQFRSKVDLKADFYIAQPQELLARIYPGSHTL